MKPYKKPYKSKSIKESIDNFYDFLSCDLYSKFRPEHKLPSGKRGKMETWYRKDFFKNEKEFENYLEVHFNILEKEIIRLIGKRKYKQEKK